MKNKKVLLYSLCCIPIIAYVVNFWGAPISDDPTEWSEFGGYIGGVYSIIMALVVVYLTRTLAIHDEQASKRRKAIDEIYHQVIKIKRNNININSVNKIYTLLNQNKLYITDQTYKRITTLANYFLEVKDGTSAINIPFEEEAISYLKNIYDGTL